MARDPLKSHRDSIITGAQAGHYDLPAAVLAAHRATTFLAAKADETRGGIAAADPDAVTAKIESDVLAAAAAGKLPARFGATIADARAEHVRLSDELRVLEAAAERADEQRGILLADHAEQVYADLNAALGELLDTVREAAPVLVDYHPDVSNAVVFLKGPEPVRAAYLALQTARERYDAVREAQRHLWAIAGGPRRDPDGMFAIVKNMLAVWPGWKGRYLTQARPWPSEPLAYLVWLAGPEVEPWIPTPEQQDALMEQLQRENAPRRTRELGVYVGP